jgi:cystathionine beta-synthase
MNIIIKRLKMLYDNALDAIGNTPLVRIPLDSPANVYAKLEYLNPGGSVKDRSAKFMIEQAELTGVLKPGGTIIDASSGNQGIAVAMIGAIKGYKVIITVSEKISSEKLGAIQAYGAETVMCPPTDFMDDPQSYHSVAVHLHEATPGSFMPNQYYNPINAQAHYTSMGPEVWEQTEGKITHFIAAAGTGGTISGTGRYLKEQNPAVQIIAVDSVNSFRSTGGHPKPYKIEGMGIDFDTDVLDESVIDKFIAVHDDPSLEILRKIAREQGILGGLSSGAVAYAAQLYCKDLGPEAVVVMIFGDSGRAYLSKNPFGSDS